MSKTGRTDRNRRSFSESLIINRLFIANRGEIALRIARTARRMNIEVASAFSSADTGLPHLRLCQYATELTGDPARVYLDIGKVLDAAKKLKADAIHPGYGFLAENEDFADVVQKAGMAFIGPTPEQILALGDKLQARKAADAAGVPTVPGCKDAISDAASGLQFAEQIGFPVLLKASGGGGGRGMRVVRNAPEFAEAFTRASSEAQAAFGDPRVFLEKYIEFSRHVEVQIVGDGKGRAVALGERECSVQRRHQKLIEESPAPAVTPQTSERMKKLAAALAASVQYRGAGTMEFIVERGTQNFYFIEMNTRLQVEHPVTEVCTGLDLVEEQIEVARNGRFSGKLEPLCAAGSVPSRGHAIEARIIAEDPDNHFRPSCGTLDLAQFPSGSGIRVDGWAEAGLAVSPYYDSLLAKVIAWGQDRAEAIARLKIALEETLIHPVHTTAPFLKKLIGEKPFASGEYDTSLLSGMEKAGPEQISNNALALVAGEVSAQKNETQLSPRQASGRAMSSWQQAG